MACYATAVRFLMKPVFIPFSPIFEIFNLRKGLQRWEICTQQAKSRSWHIYGPLDPLEYGMDGPPGRGDDPNFRWEFRTISKGSMFNMMLRFPALACRHVRVSKLVSPNPGTPPGGTPGSTSGGTPGGTRGGYPLGYPPRGTPGPPSGPKLAHVGSFFSLFWLLGASWALLGRFGLVLGVFFKFRYCFDSLLEIDLPPLRDSRTITMRGGLVPSACRMVGFRSSHALAVERSSSQAGVAYPVVLAWRGVIGGSWDAKFAPSWLQVGSKIALFSYFFAQCFEVAFF